MTVTNAQLAEWTTLARAVERHMAENKLAMFKPYPWQAEFIELSKDHPETMLMAANGVGKTLPGAVIVAIHATGRYPDWWKGRRFDRPVKVWCATLSDGFQKANNQAALLGDDTNEALGTGMIPKDTLQWKPRLRQSGIGDVVNDIKVMHVSGKASVIHFLSYKQGWRAFQGAKPDIVWADEQSADGSADEGMIFAELQTRIFRSGGMLFLTLTPLLGETETIRHFTHPFDKDGKRIEGIAWKGATWDDAPHLKEADKARLRASYPPHQLDARTRGVPLLGQGAVFTVDERQIKCDPFEIPPYFRQLIGIDFGIDHPFAAAKVAYDADADCIYVAGGFRVRNETSVYHAHGIKQLGDWQPIAWPHDGLNRKDTGAGGAIELWQMYLAHGLNMLPLSACYQDDTGGGQKTEPVVFDIIERERTGRFKVFSNVEPYFEERRSLHRKDGRIVAERDDFMKAVFYACMMLRYASPKSFGQPTKQKREPLFRAFGAAA